MTFHTRASSRCHHRFHFMAGIFQRPSSICIFKTLRMAWENCIFPVFLGITLLISSLTPPGLCLCTLCSQMVSHQRQSKPSPHWKSSGGVGGQKVLWRGCGKGGHNYGQLGSMKLGPQSTKTSSQGSGGCVPSVG